MNMIHLHLKRNGAIRMLLQRPEGPVWQRLDAGSLQQSLKKVRGQNFTISCSRDDPDREMPSATKILMQIIGSYGFPVRTAWSPPMPIDS